MPRSPASSVLVIFAAIAAATLSGCTMMLGVESQPQIADRSTDAGASRTAGVAPTRIVSMPAPSSDHERFDLDYIQEAGPEGWTTVVRLELRPPHLGWWLGWQTFECESVEGALPQFRCRFDMPREWGCAEARAYAYAWQLIDPDDLDLGVRAMRSEDYSNTLVKGECPDPMPERIPLATPEPSMVIAVAVGVLCLASMASRGPARR